MYAMAEMTANTPLVGEQAHVLYWDPSRMAWPLPSPVPEVAFSKHFLCVFRVGRTFVYVHLTGQSRNLALDITPQFVTRIADLVAKRVADHSPSVVSTRLRAASVAIRREVVRADTIARKAGWAAWKDFRTWATNAAAVASSWLTRTVAALAPTPPAASKATSTGGPEVSNRSGGSGGAGGYEFATEWSPISDDGLDVVGEVSTNGSDDMHAADYVGEDDFVEIMHDDFMTNNPGAWSSEDLWGMLPMGGVLSAALAMSWVATATA
jgi:hypothetical protein